jgi:hypothetical protein
MTKIIGISGRKQAGKNTVANYINGTVLIKHGMIQDFYIDLEGQLIVQTNDQNNNTGYGIFDVTRKDEQFIQYAERSLWPYIKTYHFADPLKEMCVNLFNLDPQNVYGNDAQKNKLTTINWESVPDNINNKTGPMTHREFLEHFGTQVVRKIYHNAWSEFALKRILKEQSEVAIIPDVRFPNEVEIIKKYGGIVIRLTRNVYNSVSESESSLDQSKFDWNNFDYILDNDTCSLDELSNKLDGIKHLWGIL